MESIDFLPACENSRKLKIVALIFEWKWSRMGMAIYLVHETLKSAVSYNECMN